MDIFIRLVLAHLLGDFVFQTDAVYKLKQSGSKGILVHVGIVTLCFIGMLWPYWDNPFVWVCIFINYMLHWGQDIVKLESEKSAKYFVIGYCLDQIFHILTVSLMFFTEFRYFSLPEENNSTLIALYNNNEFIIFIISLIVVSYVGHWFIIMLKASYSKKSDMGGKYERAYGMIERAIILAMILFVPYGIFISPFVLVGRYLDPKLKKNISRELDVILSGVIGIVTGMLFKMII